MTIFASKTEKDYLAAKKWMDEAEKGLMLQLDKVEKLKHRASQLREKIDFQRLKAISGSGCYDADKNIDEVVEAAKALGSNNAEIEKELRVVEDLIAATANKAFIAREKHKVYLAERSCHRAIFDHAREVRRITMEKINEKLPDLLALVMTVDSILGDNRKKSSGDYLSEILKDAIMDAKNKPVSLGCDLPLQAPRSAAISGDDRVCGETCEQTSLTVEQAYRIEPLPAQKVEPFTTHYLFHPWTGGPADRSCTTPECPGKNAKMEMIDSSGSAVGQFEVYRCPFCGYERRVFDPATGAKVEKTKNGMLKILE